VKRVASQWQTETILPEDAPWYVTERARRGAYATLLGLDVRFGRSEGRCRLTAVGDTNSFLLRGDTLARSFPATRSSEFGRFPDLVGTAANLPPTAWRHSHFKLKRDDVLLLATDALAAYLLERSERGEPAWPRLLEAARGSRGLRDWVDQSRGFGMNDDDTTLIVIRRVAR
jgi:hypothetical protein